MRKWKHVKESTFNQVKKLQEAGLNKVSVISKVIGYSTATTYCLMKANTFPEYPTLRNKWLGKKEKKNEVQTEVSKKDRIMSLLEQLKNELLS